MIDIHKKYTTKDDKEVRIYATDGIGLYPIHGAVLNYAGSTNDQGWSVGTWTNDGLYDIAAPNSSLNLVEVWVPKDKEPVWCWDSDEAKAHNQIEAFPGTDHVTFSTRFYALHQYRIERLGLY
jgi:hypothetical protein